MPATVTQLPPRRPSGPRPVITPARRPFRDNPRLILAGIVVLVAALAGILFLVNRSSAFSPDFLTGFVLYALSAADLTILVALVFVLARNIVKLVVERRSALPFARFRSKLVALLLAMTLVPSVLVLIIGSELIRTNIDQWFNAPMDEILAGANQIAGDYYYERQVLISDHATRMARTLSGFDLTTSDVGPIRAVLAPDVAVQRVSGVAVYRVGSASAAVPGLEPVLAIADPNLKGYTKASADRLAEQAFQGTGDTRSIESLGSDGDFLHAAAVIRARDGRAIGVLVATDYLTGELATRARRMTRAFESYNQLRVLKRPMTGLYLSIFLMVTLLILFGATWMGSYFAKRITRPVQMLEAAAREIGAGRLDQRLEPQTHDEFGALTEAFNAMAGELAATRRKVERSTVELERKHLEVEGRRRYFETILERIAAGVISVDASGAVATINSSAARLLGLDRTVLGQPARVVFERPDLQPLGALLAGATRARSDPAPHDIAIVRDGQEVHLAAIATALVGDNTVEGAVLVLDDVTPLIRAQKVAAWREVARRLAHEIKNPLTPIQLSAERLRRHFTGAPQTSRDLVEECTRTIVGEVESLKGLVDEFSQFARMPAPRTVATDLHELILETLALYDGIFTDVRIERRFGSDVPRIQLDPEQIKRVMINLVDNAVEAMDRRGGIVVETAHDAGNNLVRIVVADDGPGIPAADRDKLFLPYYSTKGRGSGLGLAIVRRIIAEHGGSIEAGDNTPHGTRFTIELPC